MWNLTIMATLLLWKSKLAPAELEAKPGAELERQVEEHVVEELVAEAKLKRPEPDGQINGLAEEESVLLLVTASGLALQRIRVAQSHSRRV